MTGRCKTCRSWQVNGDGNGDCSCPKLSGGTEREDLEPDGLFVGAYDDFLFFVSGPLFGCIHHKER